MRWNDRARAALKQKGWSIAELARRAELELEALYKQLREVDQPRGDVLGKIAAALGVTVTWLRHGEGLPYSEIPVVGFTSAGEGFVPFDDHDKGAAHDVVTIDFGDYPIAVEVRGNSMLPVYRPGDRLMGTRRDGKNVAEFLGADCVAVTATGEGYVKRLMKGTRSGFFTLRSYNNEFKDIEDVAIAWAARIDWVRRR